MFYYDYKMSGSKQLVVVTTNGFIQGFEITQNLKQFDISHDREATEMSEMQLELNRKKIELQNKIKAMKEKKEAAEAQKLKKELEEKEKILKA